MELDKAIEQRFSVKSFTKKNVDFGIISKLLDVAIKAPSAGNLQDWRFIVVDDNDKKNGIAKACKEQMWVGQASAIVVVCSDLVNLERFYGSRGEVYGIEDCSAATENILLKAVDLGVNATWISAFDEDEVARILRTPENYKIVSVVPVGYSEEKFFEKKRNELNTFTYFNEYGNATMSTSAFPVIKEENVTAVKEGIKESKGFFSKIKDKFKDVREEMKKEDE
ncbi:nitroreductase family protein [Candidatus Woesearchaeota archaeon]|nr:nitroreductase family protein [Candidatus Woesearchaeota archaeon]